MSTPPTRARPIAVVAGATGYSGGHVALALDAAGYSVRALARDEARLAHIRHAIDEVRVVEATQPETLRGAFDGATVAFSSVGIRHVHRHPTFREVDGEANVSLVTEAARAGVKHFAFLSVYRGDELRSRLALADARERAVDLLTKLSNETPLRASILRPTGFFNDMAEFFSMAQHGRVWLLGDGSAQVNPIHGADLADAVVSAFERQTNGIESIPLGGPEVFSLRDLGELAFRITGNTPRFGHIPTGIVTGFGSLVAPFNPNMAAMARAFGIMVGDTAIAPTYGTRTVEDFYRHLASGGDVFDG